jgi:hypothetical protein
LVSTTSHEINSKQQKERDGISKIGKKSIRTHHTPHLNQNTTHTPQTEEVQRNKYGSMNITMSF